MNLSAHTRAHNSLRGAPEAHTAWRGSPFLLQLVSPVSLHSLPSIVPCHSADTFSLVVAITVAAHLFRLAHTNVVATASRPPKRPPFIIICQTRSISSLRRHSFFGRLDLFVLDVPSFSCVLILAALVRRVILSFHTRILYTSHHIISQHSTALCSPLSILVAGLNCQDGG